jgi:hypothetical protein
MRRRPGEVRDAIVKFLQAKREGASIAEIRRGVESALGARVAPSSVRSYLRLNSGEHFVREGRGRYRLRKS